ncbi:MAG: hypothetical protein WAU56_07465 [Steroidobacteraceae bacterium]
MSGRPRGSLEPPRQIFLKHYKRYGKLLAFIATHAGSGPLPRSGPRAVAMLKAAAAHMGCAPRTVRRDLEWLGWQQPDQVWLAQLRWFTDKINTVTRRRQEQQNRIDAVASYLIEQDFSERDLAALIARVRAGRCKLPG